MPENFDTKTIELAAGPVNLLADPDILAELDRSVIERGMLIFLQNVSTRAKIYYAEQGDAPARSHVGHCLFVGDGFVIRLREGEPSGAWEGEPSGAWVWAHSTGTAAISLALDKGQ